VLANRAATTLFSLLADDLGRPFHDLELSYRPLELRSHIHQATSAGQTVWVRDVRWDGVDGVPLAFDVQIAPLSDESGASLGVTMIFNDVTKQQLLVSELGVVNRQLEHAYEELQSTNEELVQSNEQLRVRTREVGKVNGFMEAVLASLDVGVAVVDESLQVSAWNRRAEELWGLRPDEAMGRPLRELDIGLPLDEIEAALQSTLASSLREQHEIELAAVNRRGHRIQVRVTVSPMREEDAAAGAILVMDVTD
jgi:two-component system CheB/CheR fusion protein